MILKPNINNTIFFVILCFPLFLISGAFVINSILFLILIFFLYFLKKKINVFKDSYFFFFLIIYLYLIVNTFLSVHFYNSLSRNFFFFKYIILIYILKYFLEKNKLFLLKISKVWLFILIFLCFDILFQSFFGFNIVGYQTTSIYRNSSFFFSELKAASFINGLGFLTLSLFFYYSQNRLFLMPIILLFTLAAFLTGERANFIKCFILSLFFLNYIFSNTNYIKKFLFVGITSLSLILLIFFTNNNLKTRFNSDFFNQTEFFKFEKIYIQSKWGGHASAALEIFYNNFLWGVGSKNFRVVCKDYEEKVKKKYDNKNEICSTHPHQFYYELISEHGILGTIIIFFSIVTIIFLRLKKKNLSIVNKVSLAYIIVSILPIIPTGSFFTTYDATIFWLNFSFFLFHKR
jgi:O-antigen ligase